MRTHQPKLLQPDTPVGRTGPLLPSIPSTMQSCRRPHVGGTRHHDGEDEQKPERAVVALDPGHHVITALARVRRTIAIRRTRPSVRRLSVAFLAGFGSTSVCQYGLTVWCSGSIRSCGTVFPLVRSFLCGFRGSKRGSTIVPRCAKINNFGKTYKKAYNKA